MASKYQIIYTMQYFDDFNSIADYYTEEWIMIMLNYKDSVMV